MTHRHWPAALFGLILLAGCTDTGGPASVPPLRPETIPKPPVSGEVLNWRPGHWNWTGSGYVWTPGQYVPAAGHGPNWLPGHWTQSGSGWTWNPARWVD